MRALTLAVLAGGVLGLPLSAHAVIMTFSVPAVVTASSVYFEAPGDAFDIFGHADLTQTADGVPIDFIPAVGDLSFTVVYDFSISLDDPPFGPFPYPTFHFTNGKLAGIDLHDVADNGGHVSIGGSGAAGVFDVNFGFNPFDPSQSFVGYSGTVDFSESTFAGVPVGGVPEPFGWSLMLVGFGLAGAALRRMRLPDAPTLIWT